MKKKLKGGLKVDSKGLLNTGLTYCNYFSIFTNIIIIIVCIVFTLWFINFNNNNFDTSAKVVSIENSEKRKCFNMPATGNRKDINSLCNLTLSYNVNGQELTSSIEYTGYIEDYNIGEIINISYNKNDPYKITRNKKMYTILLYISIVILILTAIGTYLRIYHSDNKFIQLWIGFTCLETLFGNR